MTTNKFNTIEMTRHIRNAQYEQIKDKTLSERIAFYHNKAQAFHRQLGIEIPTISPVEPDNVPTPAVHNETHPNNEA